MPITIYPGTIKKRNANGTYSDLVPGTDVHASEIEGLQDIVGDGQLSGFTATDLTGAANELKNTLNQLDQNMAYVESGNTASRPYTYGQFISWKGTLYTVSDTNGIASGVSFSTGTGGNLVGVVGGGLNEIKDSLAVEVYTDGAGVKYVKHGNVVFASIYGILESALYGRAFPTNPELRPVKDVDIFSTGWLLYNGSKYSAIAGVGGIGTDSPYWNFTYLPTYPADNVNLPSGSYVYCNLTYICR